MSRKKSKKFYRPRYFYVTARFLFIREWITVAEKITKNEVEKLVRRLALSGEYSLIRVYDYKTDTLLVTYRVKPKKKKCRIKIIHKKFSTLAIIDCLSPYEKFKYICKKINQGLLVRFVFKVKQASPKTAMLIKQKKVKKQKEYYVTSEWNRFSSCESMNKYLNLRSRSYEEISTIYYMIRR